MMACIGTVAAIFFDKQCWANATSKFGFLLTPSCKSICPSCVPLRRYLGKSGFCANVLDLGLKENEALCVR